MIKLAVIGVDVSQSSSPPIHYFLAEEFGKKISYERISVDLNSFEEKINGLLSSYDGLNVTIPYKLNIIPHLNEICGDAAIFGAVNTVDCNTLKGYNTDGLGFMRLLTANKIDAANRDVLVLGAGGAGRSVAKKLADCGARVEVYNRTYEKAAALEREFPQIKAVRGIEKKRRYLIINATGVGMHNSVGVSPVGEDILSLCDNAVDLIYNPEKSEFLNIAARLNKKAVNGFAMLFYQAYYADCIFFGVQPDEELATALYNKFTGVKL